MPRPSRSRQLALDLTALAAPLAGIDEAGRGPLAGPVVAAAVVWGEGPWPKGLTDSKLLSARRRDSLFDRILEGAAAYGIGMAGPEEIDAINIREATFRAMERAVEALALVPGSAVVDGNALPRLACPARAVIGGDALIPAISAASILAKVTRDRLMEELDAAYPGYGWRQNKGYPTSDHRRALAELGPSPHHRRSFAPVRAVLPAA